MAPFTADEAWSYHKFNGDLGKDALVLQPWPKVQQDWNQGNELIDAQLILDFKESLVNDSLEALRAKKEIGQSLEAEIEIHMPVNDPRFKTFQKRLDDLA